MHYPLVKRAFDNNLTLFIPNPLLIKPTYETLCINDPATLFPFWAKLWPSSLALSLFLQKNIHLIQNKVVLEIGAGIGLPSFSIANEVSTITITDYATEAVDLMKMNIKHLGNQHIQAICADWNSFPDTIHADIVLLSDTNYAPSNFESLIKLIQGFIKKGATIIIATPKRITASPFIQQLESFIVKRELVDISSDAEIATIGLFVLK